MKIIASKSRLRITFWITLSIIIFSFLFNSCKSLENKSNKYSWIETDTTIALYALDTIVWKYNFGTEKEKPFFHPINIGSTTLTALSPEDHPWHLGLWFSWKYIDGVNYWEYDNHSSSKEGPVYGITEIKAVEINKHDDYSCTIKINISYHEKNLPEILKEQRTIYISSPTEGEYYMDFEIETMSVVDSVELNRTPLPDEEGGKLWGGYAGLSLRFNTELRNTNFINEDGSSEMKHGESFNWIYFGLKNRQNDRIGTAIFDHPQNLNNPTHWYVTNVPEKPYNFNFLQPAVIFKKPFEIVKDEKLRLSYRVMFYKSGTTHDIVKEDWSDFITIRNRDNKK